MTWFSACFCQQDSFVIDQRVNINREISNLPNAKLYSYKELQTATENFNQANKIGEGGFGSVYKGKLNDGTLAAIKVLSSQSEQGVREFLNEIVAISGVEHENLVKLYGCCTEKGQRILVYGYLENNSLAQTLLRRHSDLQFSWKLRTKICIGVAQGLAFLHDEIQPHIVHRDIKASNILLDRDFTPKIADFGLAKLFPATMTHISTRVAGTFGYLAPEYAIRGKLTRKADIYSFGVLLLEIISGRCNMNKKLPVEEQNLLEWAWMLYENKMPTDLIDKSLEGDFNTDEACRFVKIGLLCTQDKPKNRPTMSAVAKMLKGENGVDEMELLRPALLKELMALKASSNAPSSSSGASTNDGSSSCSQSTNMSCATMSFSSIYDRSN
ncbi:Protein kinase superfamily protein [Striga hermonthica]|uniref:Protein kinase superfamily protein n=1 Tax=Striga hermonthica TaxID=68872 RepID=A0A9N7MFA7_STRHE|nr:Protein kinase superfamily protein [Striga hermonthica]